MDTFYEIKPGLLKHASLALGFFDGVHPGHEVVISKAVEEARTLGATPAIVTFKEHPRSLTLGKSPPLLTLIDQRLELFAALGIEAALVLSFTEELCHMAPQDYVKAVLVDCMGASALSIGFNHRFGRNRVGDPELLRQLGEQFNYTVHVAGEVIIDGAPVSSSRIRQALAQGQVQLAAQLLSRHYAVNGQVQHGNGRGNQIGFPTANLALAPEQVMPAIGVYTGIVRLADKRRLPGLVNIGRRPTFGDDQPISTEVHILDFNANIYGQNLSLEFVDFIRAEMKFDGVESLKAQIAADVNKAREYFAQHSQRLNYIEKLPAELL